jgi:hypothetical protein
VLLHLFQDKNKNLNLIKNYTENLYYKIKKDIHKTTKKNYLVFRLGYLKNDDGWNLKKIKRKGMGEKKKS